MSKQYDHDVLLRWRSELTDFEEDTLIPSFRSRLEAFEEMFQKMLVMLERVRSDVVYLTTVERVLNPANVKMESSTTHAGVLYCDEIGKVIREQYIARIKVISKELDSAKDFRGFRKFVSSLDQLCLSIMQNKANLFLYSLRPYVNITNFKTNEMLTTVPVEYAMILRPFDVWIDNLDLVAKGTSGTIETWRKSQTDWKSQYLAFRSNESNANSNRILLMVNISTVALAISLSFLFLFVPDVFTSKKNESQLNSQIMDLKKDLGATKAETEMFKSKCAR